jgi:hypothetical protein
LRFRPANTYVFLAGTAREAGRDAKNLTAESRALQQYGVGRVLDSAMYYYSDMPLRGRVDRVLGLCRDSRPAAARRAFFAFALDQSRVRYSDDAERKVAARCAESDVPVSTCACVVAVAERVYKLPSFIRLGSIGRASLPVQLGALRQDCA